MKMSFRLDMLLVCVAFALGVACTPQFNKDKKKEETATTPNTSTRVYQQAFDPNTAGGGALGTSTSFRVSGVNVGYVSKKTGTTASGVTVKGGIHGQMAQ